MLNENAKKLFSKLDMKYQAVAIKYHFSQPENVERTNERLSFCQFVKKAQDENRGFYIQVEDEDCLGKVILGMIPKPPLDASGILGRDFGVFRTSAPNAVLHASYPTMTPGTVNYAEFCPVSLCSFHPDIVICVADIRQADIIMRASSYISGDLWESKTSCVASCAWTYVYPFMTGKVNFCTTGMHHGMKRRRVYPEGLQIISIPFQKLDEIILALGEMPWELVTMKQDPESKAELAKIMAHWKELSPEGGLVK